MGESVSESVNDNARVFALPRRRRQDGWTSTPGANAPSSSCACFGGLVAAGASAKTYFPGLELEGVFSALRSIACLPARPPYPRSVFLLIAFTFRVSAWLYRTGCLPFCVLVALGGFDPSALTGLGPPASSMPGAGHSV